MVLYELQKIILATSKDSCNFLRSVKIDLVSRYP